MYANGPVCMYLLRLCSSFSFVCVLVSVQLFTAASQEARVENRGISVGTKWMGSKVVNSDHKKIKKQFLAGRAFNASYGIITEILVVLTVLRPYAILSVFWSAPPFIFVPVI